jgi:hypothetical protein
MIPPADCLMKVWMKYFNRLWGLAEEAADWQRRLCQPASSGKLLPDYFRRDQCCMHVPEQFRQLHSFIIH